MTETRAYLIDLDEYEDIDSIEKMTDDEFITISEKQGEVYTLEGFQKNWNNENILFNSYLRFINVELNEKQIHLDDLYKYR